MLKKKCFIVFPTQLYDTLHVIPQDCDILLVEDPVFYFDAKYKPFKVHKIKIAFLHACIEMYLKCMKKQRQMRLISWQEIQNHKYFFLQSYEHAMMYDPIDHDIMDKYTSICNKYNIDIVVLDSPDLLVSKDTMQKEYFDVKKESVRHASFYKYMKEKLGVLKNVSNMDKMNRSPPPKEPPHLYKYKPPQNLRKIYNDAINFANVNFPEHYGTPDNVIMFPITHKDAQKAFENFLNERFHLFGTYEDAIMKDDPFMYHSVISPLLNIGLLTSKYILNRTLEFYQDNKSSIPLSSLEGYLRQIIGWRCFMQSLYIFKGKQLQTSNLPNNHNKFRDIHRWYKGETGIVPIDEEIKKVAKFGYAHHIVRLMVFMNFFILCEIHPHEIYKWFMEVVSMDAYSWVMVSNIYVMGYFYPKLMTKPYLSTSNYIMKMSNYKKDGVWNTIWDGLYHEFVKNKPKEYTFFYQRTASKTSQFAREAKVFKATHFNH